MILILFIHQLFIFQTGNYFLLFFCFLHAVAGSLLGFLLSVFFILLTTYDKDYLLSLLIVYSYIKTILI